MRLDPSTRFLAAAVGSAALLLAGCVSEPVKEEVVEEKVYAYPSPPEEPRFFFERMVMSTGDANTLDKDSKLKELLTGVASTTGGVGFNKPYDVEARGGRLYVSDSARRTVYVMDYIEKRHFTVGDRGGEGTLSKPLGIALDDQRNLYVADNTNDAVYIYDPEGNFLRSVGDSETLSRPSGVEVTPDGSRVFVLDTGGVDSAYHRIVVFDGMSGELINTIGTRGAEEGQFNLPRDITYNRKNGLIYVTDGGNFRVQAFDTDGKFQRTWGQVGTQLGQFGRPKGIATDSDGNIYVADAAFGNFQIFNEQGQLLLFIGSRSSRFEPGSYMLPNGIAIDEDDRIYLVDQYFRRVDIFRPATLEPTQGFMGNWYSDKAADK